MADNMNQSNEGVLSNAQIIGWTKKQQKLEQESILLRQEIVRIESQLADNRGAQHECLAALTSHLKATGKHRLPVILDDQSLPKVALIEHPGWNMYPTRAVDITFLDNPVR